MCIDAHHVTNWCRTEYRSITHHVLVLGRGSTLVHFLTRTLPRDHGKVQTFWRKFSNRQAKISQKINFEINTKVAFSLSVFITQNSFYIQTLQKILYCHVMLLVSLKHPTLFHVSVKLGFDAFFMENVSTPML